MKRLVNRTVNQLPLADSLRVEQTTKTTTTTIGGNQKSEQVKKACYDVTSTRYVELKAAAVRPKTDRRSMRDTVKFVTVHSRLTQASELQKLTDRWLSGLIRRSRAQLPPAPLSPCCGLVGTCRVVPQNSEHIDGIHQATERGVGGAVVLLPAVRP